MLPDRPAAPDPRTVASKLLSQGDYVAAAAAYAELAAGADGSQAATYQGIQALALQDAGDPGAADAAIAAARGDAASLDVAKACSMLHAGLGEDAYQTLAGIDAGPLPPYVKGARARCLGAAALTLQRYDESATASIEGYRHPYPAAALPALNDTTWRALSRLPAAELETRAAGADTTAAGWYQLGLTATRTMFDLATFGTELDAWQARFPGHPASALIETLRERAEALAVRPRHIALLLPFDDTLGPAARAVRDGVMMAWYSDRDTASRPAISVYSTAAGPLAEVVSRALADGADYFIGPLRKDEVETLQHASDLVTSVLALNVAEAPTSVRANFYQFGLTPENEAVQVARRAYVRGPRALVLGPTTSWGQRLTGAYAEAWRDVGGEVLATVTFAERADAYAEAVKRALNIDASEARAAAIRRRLGIPIQSAPRRRADIDVILLAAFPENARQVMPQLRYFGAGDIPVFATSHVYSGQAAAESDIDLDGIVFGDMPWLFGLADPATFNIVRRHWGGQSTAFARLYALGIDAYRALPFLPRMRFQPGTRVPGVTGVLTMNGQGVVQRELTWLQFVGGRPRVLDGLAAVVPR